MKPIPLDIAWHVFNHSDTHVQSQFARCSRDWHSFFNPQLYQHDVKKGRHSAIFNTIAYCTDTQVALATLEHSYRAGADYNKPAVMYLTEAQQPSPYLITALYLAASKGYSDIVSFLLDRGADIDGVPDCRLRTPVFISLLSRDAETSMVLLRRGARLESPEFGINALHQAAAAGLTEVITYLIEEKGLGVDTVDSNGDTPLIHSLLSPSPETVIAHLARFEVDVNQPTTIDTWRMTALSMSCEDGMFSAALSLLEAGADATGESDGLVEGADPALRIYEQKPLELALLARSEKTHGRTAAAKQKLVDRLIESGADPDATVCISARCNWTGPLLLKLVRLRRRWEAELLLSSGLLNIDQCDSHGATTLTWTLSTCHGDPVMASILLRRGAKMDEGVLRTVVDKLVRLACVRDHWGVISLLTREPKLLKVFHVLYSHCFWVASKEGDAVATRFVQDSPRSIVRMVTEMLKKGISLTKTGVLHVMRSNKCRKAKPGPVIAMMFS
ncbi:ankyrin repeat protein [Colletotrichum truncatum]|uniref:Ankyrin repeat protein n=2 Tax=Colletotrichum truncatum TaxID=5467 RepID=A0ACC3YEJ6_COLTU|nr:ankyrin repeat protein [Colletotrichum truncatum]XP_036584641.1 ankyrin repeat protein [Colletotrichum truncatum]KAF6783288.1 ankyrin repeat protein [Colletotrichum truncatum]KAF6794159.1 ankyrin repeat protein [Colletotrichum truncatum]